MKRLLIYIFSICALIFLADKITSPKKEIKSLNKEFIDAQRVPLSAFWIKHEDGGHWFDVSWIHAHKNSAGISIYNASGDLIEKSKFSMLCSSSNPKYIEDLKKQISHYDGEHIQLKEDSCYLQNRKRNY